MTDAVIARLLNDYQRDFPLEPRPYARIGAELGISEDAVLTALRQCRDDGTVSRVGAVVRPNAVGVSTLAAMAVPGVRLHEVAAIVSARLEVNHNYEREHELNLWFVATAPDAAQLAACLAAIERDSGLTVVRLPLEADYHIDLGFALQ